MRLPLFSPRQNRQSNRVLLVDINSANVTTLSIFSDDLKTAKITGIGKAPLEHGDVRNGAITDLERVHEALETSVAQAIQDTEADIRDVIFGVNGELALGTTTTARSSRGKHGPFTEQEVKTIDQIITDNAQIAVRNEHLDTTGVSDIDLDVVTYSTVYTKVNGKVVQNPLEMEGELLEMAKYTAFTPSFHITTLQKLAKKAGLKIVAVIPEMFGLVKALSNDVDYVAVNISSDFTEVAVIFGGGIISNKWLPIGAQHFTKEIAQRMGLSLKEAERIKKSYVYGKLTQSESMIVQGAFGDTLDLWLSGLELLFNEFRGVKTFASKIYVVGEGSELPDVFEAMDKEPWTKTIPFKQPPEFYRVKLENIQQVSDSTGNADYPEYLMPAGLATLFLEILNDQN